VNAHRDQSGQALLLALGFLVFFGLVVGALMAFVGANVLATERLHEQRSTAYAADGAVDAAIQIARLDPAVGAFGATPCMHASAFTTTASTSDGTVTTVTCTSLADPIDLDRTVRFTASVGGTAVVVADVLIHDGVAGTGVPGVEVLRWTYCGHDPGSCP
jgi:Flp pilus assembly protein TadG